MDNANKDIIRKTVRDNYAKVAGGNSGCGCSPSCCGADNILPADISLKLGYSSEDLSSTPEGSNMGLGCGNPQAIASLKPGETILDLGSGGGFDSFLAAKAVGESGFVIGVDMTPEMISLSRENAVKSGFTNIEFRLGEIENLPVADSSVDVIISNCVINLSPEKEKVFSEAFRVLKSGGRLAISDIVTSADLPEDIKKDMKLYAGCVAGAVSIPEIEYILKNNGFEKIIIRPKDESATFICNWAPGRNIEDYIVSATIEAVKPESNIL